MAYDLLIILWLGNSLADFFANFGHLVYRNYKEQNTNPLNLSRKQLHLESTVHKEIADEYLSPKFHELSILRENIPELDDMLVFFDVILV